MNLSVGAFDQEYLILNYRGGLYLLFKFWMGKAYSSSRTLTHTLEAELRV